MRVTLPYKLSAVRLVDGWHVKAMYDAIAAVVNGALGATNFARRARIGNANKAAARAWFVLEGQLGTFQRFDGDGSYGDATVADKTPSRVNWIVPAFAPLARSGTVKVARWSACLYRQDWLTLTAGTVKLYHNGVEKDSFALAAAVSGKLFDRAIAEFTVAKGDTLDVRVAGCAGTCLPLHGLTVAVWLKTEHLA
jgi:hypothetical protein